MNTSGEAAEQVVRMSLQGTELALKIAGKGTERLAVLLYTILSQQKRTKGRIRLESMLKSEKPLKIFSLKNSNLNLFAKEAKQYGVLYCALRNPKSSPDGITDILVRADDAPKINRIVERFELVTVDTTALNREPVQTQTSPPSSPIQGQDTLGNPTTAKTENAPPSELFSTAPDSSGRGTSSDGRRSVREELREIRAGQVTPETTPTRIEPKKYPRSTPGSVVGHKQPKPVQRKKSKVRPAKTSR